MGYRRSRPAVGWRLAELTDCPNGIYLSCGICIRGFYTARKPAVDRHGLHSSLFKQLLFGFMLADGWLEKHGQGVRLGISLTERFADVAQWYIVLLNGMGYSDRLDLGAPLVRKRKDCKPYYQVRTFTFASLFAFYNQWYTKINNDGFDKDYGCVLANTLIHGHKSFVGEPWRAKVVKVLPDYAVLFEMLTPIVLAVWIMGDGSGMRDGGFKLSSHSFTMEQNQLLCSVLMDKYGIKATVHRDRRYFHVYVWKRSIPLLHSLVKPYLLPSCEYKFRHVK